MWLVLAHTRARYSCDQHPLPLQLFCFLQEMKRKFAVPDVVSWLFQVVGMVQFVFLKKNQKQFIYTMTTCFKIFLSTAENFK